MATPVIAEQEPLPSSLILEEDKSNVGSPPSAALPPPTTRTTTPTILSRRAQNGARTKLSEFANDIYGPFVSKYQSEQTSYADFCFGNPHDPPLPQLVQALSREASRGLDPDCPPSHFQYQFRFEQERDAIVQSLQRRRGPTYQTATKDDVLVTNGAFAGLLMVLHTCTDVGDQVIVPSPDYFGYEGILQALECTPIYVPLSPHTNFDLDVEALAQAAIAHPKARVLILTCPNNPSGRLYTRERLHELSLALQAANIQRAQLGYPPIVVLSDEAYHRIVFPSTSHSFVSPAEEYSHTISVYSYAKTCMAPSERLGWVTVGPLWPSEEVPALRDALGQARLFLGMLVPSNTNARCIPHLEGVADDNNDDAKEDGVCVDLHVLQRRRDALVAALSHEDSIFPTVITPESGFYILVQVPTDDHQYSGLTNDVEVCRLLGSEPYKLLVMPMSMTSQLSGWLRWSITASDAMIELAVPGLHQFFRDMKRRRQWHRRLHNNNDQPSQSPPALSSPPTDATATPN